MQTSEQQNIVGVNPTGGSIIHSLSHSSHEEEFGNDYGIL